jgi:protein SCO1
MRFFIFAAAFVVAVLAGVVLFDRNSPAPVASQSGVVGAFALQSTSGKNVTEKDFLGQPYLVFFGFTHCPEICPTKLFEISQILKEMGESTPIRTAFITIDPERDTQELLTKYINSFDPRIQGLTGSRTAIDAVLKNFKAYSRKVPTTGTDYTMDHSTTVYIMDKNGAFVRSLDMKKSAEVLAAELKTYL